MNNLPFIWQKMCYKLYYLFTFKFSCVSIFIDTYLSNLYTIKVHVGLLEIHTYMCSQWFCLFKFCIRWHKNCVSVSANGTIMNSVRGLQIPRNIDHFYEIVHTIQILCCFLCGIILYKLIFNYLNGKYWYFSRPSCFVFGDLWIKL